MILKVSETYRTQSSASPDYAQLSYSPQHQQHQRRQQHSNRVHYEQEPVAPRSSSTSNEIIAYVNMPSTTRSPSHQQQQQQQQQRHYENYQRQHLSPPASNQHQHHNPIMKSLSKSESKLDSWRLWPDYTVEQETDTSVMSNLVETTSPPHVLTAPPHQPTANSNNSWIKTFASSSNADSCRFGYLKFFFCSIKKLEHSNICLKIF